MRGSAAALSPRLDASGSRNADDGLASRRGVHDRTKWKQKYPSKLCVGTRRSSACRAGRVTQERCISRTRRTCTWR